MCVNWLLPLRIVTRCAAPGTRVTSPPPRNSTESKCGTGTISLARAGTEASNVQANNGAIVRIIMTPFDECATSVALQLQRVQPHCGGRAKEPLGGHDQDHRQLRQPLRPQGSRLHEPQGPRL